MKKRDKKPRTAYCLGCSKIFPKMHLLIAHRNTFRCGGRFAEREEDTGVVLRIPLPLIPSQRKMREEYPYYREWEDIHAPDMARWSWDRPKAKVITRTDRIAHQIICEMARDRVSSAKIGMRRR